jgi:hypothetical protein
MRHVALVSLAAFGLAACNEGGPMAGSRGGTLALESVEGLNEPAKATLANAVASQGSARSIALVGRGEPSPYRVKAYLAPSGPQVSYVFDVFDNANRRALRVQGEEVMSSSTLDDATASRIAARSLDQMGGLFDPVQMQARNNGEAYAATSDVGSASSGGAAMGGPYVPLGQPLR